jgi:hypothetical protein
MTVRPLRIAIHSGAAGKCDIESDETKSKNVFKAVSAFQLAVFGP